MLWPARFTPLHIKRTRAALMLTLIAAACDDRVATDPQHAATQRASRDINPQPTRSFSVLPGELYFGSQALGTSSAPQVDTIRNTGTDSITMYIGGGNPFPLTNTCPTILAPNQFCTVSVRFAPTSAGLWIGMLMITSNALTSPYLVGLYGTGYVPVMSVTPTSLGFGSVAVGNVTPGKIVKITSTGNGPLVVSSLTIGGANPGDFSIVADGCSGASLPNGASCTARVSFEPFRLGARTATLSIASNAGSPVSVSLSGTGAKAGGGGYTP